MYPHYKQKILSFYDRHKRMPAYSEIMTLLNFKSKNAVYKLVQKLVDEGVVEKDASGRLLPASLASEREVRLLGLVEAGFPMVAEEDTSEKLNLDEFLVSDRESTYLLEVKGDSMIEEGIMEGDLVLVERRGTPKDGDIVIAEVDGGWTMKYYRNRGGKVYLEPANKKYKPIYPAYDLKVTAIVRGVIRKY